jgi:hypothetical protein
MYCPCNSIKNIFTCLQQEVLASFHNISYDCSHSFIKCGLYLIIKSTTIERNLKIIKSCMLIRSYFCCLLDNRLILLLHNSSDNAISEYLYKPTLILVQVFNILLILKQCCKVSRCPRNLTYCSN